MALTYNVTIMEHGQNRERETWHYFDGLTLTQAWCKCERHARRGFNRFGGAIVKHNWGMRGGRFPTVYRTATIRIDFEGAVSATMWRISGYMTA